jgi:polyisoprenoid-binding protein YceI
MRHLLLTTALSLLATPIFAAEWVINPATSKLTFLAQFNHAPITGVFQKWGGKINFDADHLDTSNLTINVDLSSVSTQDASRDETLKGPDFFNAKTFSTATYTSSKITKTSQGYVAAGTLSLAGVSKQLAVPFTLTTIGKSAQANGVVKLSRRAFGIGKGQWQDASQIDDMVDVTFTVNATTN